MTEHEWVTLQVSVEIKEGHEGAPLPSGREVAVAVQDTMGDLTKHEQEFSYRTGMVMAVGEVQTGTVERDLPQPILWQGNRPVSDAEAEWLAEHGFFRVQ